jgi:hypothetical protein
MSEQAKIKRRLDVFWGETLKQTCGTLSLPSECDRVLEIVKSRADKLIKTLA